MKRDENPVTDRSFVRMRSQSGPTILIEIFQWTDAESFGRAQENAAVLHWWTQYEAMWMGGGFGLEEVPESKMPWAQYDSIE